MFIVIILYHSIFFHRGSGQFSKKDNSYKVIEENTLLTWKKKQKPKNSFNQLTHLHNAMIVP